MNSFRWRRCAPGGRRSSGYRQTLRWKGPRHRSPGGSGAGGMRALFVSCWCTGGGVTVPPSGGIFFGDQQGGGARSFSRIITHERKTGERKKGEEKAPGIVSLMSWRAPHPRRRCRRNGIRVEASADARLCKRENAGKKWSNGDGPLVCGGASEAIVRRYGPLTGGGFHGKSTTWFW